MLIIAIVAAHAEPTNHLRAQVGPIGIAAPEGVAVELSLELEHLFVGRAERHGLGLRGVVAASGDLFGDTNGLFVLEPGWVSTFRVTQRTFAAVSAGLGLGLLQREEFSEATVANAVGVTAHGSAGLGWRPGPLEFTLHGRLRAFNGGATFTPVLGVGAHW